MRNVVVALLRQSDSGIFNLMASLSLMHHPVTPCDMRMVVETMLFNRVGPASSSSSSKGCYHQLQRIAASANICKGKAQSTQCSKLCLMS